MKVNLLDFDLPGLIGWCEGLGEKKFRATQLFRWSITGVSAISTR